MVTKVPSPLGRSDKHTKSKNKGIQKTEEQVGVGLTTRHILLCCLGYSPLSFIHAWITGKGYQVGRTTPTAYNNERLNALRAKDEGSLYMYNEDLE